jgi:septal ring factor EnvC (AmiA/AmiB activator)
VLQTLAAKLCRKAVPQSQAQEEEDANKQWEAELAELRHQKDQAYKRVAELEREFKELELQLKNLVSSVFPFSMSVTEALSRLGYS